MDSTNKPIEINYCKEKIAGLNKETDLDFFYNTPDDLFNKNAQFWYFGFTGNRKPNTKKEFITFIKAIYEIYCFIEQNLNSPFGCIEKLKKVVMDKAWGEIGHLKGV